MKTESVQPKELKKIGNKELKITWSDGHESAYPFRYLRQNCGCAHCVDEWSAKPILDRKNVPETIEGLKVNVVGHYALSIVFSDGHSTGIYPYKLLRKICACKECAEVNYVD